MISPKLIVIRGNSGSGKGTVAQRVREMSSRKTALVGLDHLRRVMLHEREKDPEGLANVIGLIEQTVSFALGKGYDVILEGILSMERYGEMLGRLKDVCHDHHFFYMDVSFEETLRRHATKLNAQEFGESEMRRWYKPHDVTGFNGEEIISESCTVEQAAEMVFKKVGL